jgi:hypothetical protein
MKIERFNENENIDNNLIYKGELIFKFEVKRKDLIRNARLLYSDNYLNENGLEGVLYEYVKHLESKTNNVPIKELVAESENVKLDYEIYDKDGNIVDKKIFDNIEKYNI